MKPSGLVAMDLTSCESRTSGAPELVDLPITAPSISFPPESSRITAEGRARPSPIEPSLLAIRGLVGATLADRDTALRFSADVTIAYTTAELGVAGK